MVQQRQRDIVPMPRQASCNRVKARKLLWQSPRTMRGRFADESSRAARRRADSMTHSMEHVRT
jgi:hypothetical protein